VVRQFETSVKVAQTFFTNVARIGIAYGMNYPDALTGGTHIAHVNGPLLLVNTTVLPGAVAAFLSDNKTSIQSGFVYGGVSVVADNVLGDVQTAIT
jgi:hypothetical protein